MTTASAAVERGQEELRAARLLLDGGFPSQAVSRAWAGACHAASATLSELGEQPRSSAAIVSAFGRRATAGDGLDIDAARSLRRLYDDRNDIDFALAQPPLDHALGLLEDAERVVASTVSWLGVRAGPS